MCPIAHVPPLAMCENVKKMWSYQKDVKLSKRCQMSKSQTHGLWRRFTKKINSHNAVHTYWCQFWCHIWWWPKTLKMCIESAFEQFWWPSYLMSKLTSICVNLIMWIYFFVNLLHSPGVWLFDIFLTTWDILTFDRPNTPSQKNSFRTTTCSQREIFSEITKEGTSPWPG